MLEPIMPPTLVISLATLTCKKTASLFPIHTAPAKPSLNFAHVLRENFHMLLSYILYNLPIHGDNRARQHCEGQRCSEGRWLCDLK